MKSAEHLVRVSPHGPLVPISSEIRAVENARSQVERVVRISPAERHFLEVFEAPSFKKAMKDYTNFCTFLSMAGVEADEIRVLPSRRFVEMLQEAVTASPENAELFIESMEELLETINDLEALQRAYIAALKTFQRHHPRRFKEVLENAATQSVAHAKFFVNSLGELSSFVPNIVLGTLGTKAMRKIIGSLSAKRRS